MTEIFSAFVRFLIFFKTMRYDCIKIDTDFLKKVIKQRGLTERQFCIFLWGEKTHRVIKDFERRPNLTIETAMKVCNTLDISLDELFTCTNNVGQYPNIVGNENIINSSVVNNDINALRAEIKALKSLLKEKDERIGDLKKQIEDLNKRLDFLIRLGHISDNK